VESTKFRPNLKKFIIVNKISLSMVSVSCIIPAYNEGSNISKVLDSVKDYSRFDEIIVVDDCSKDNTCSVVESYVKDWPKIRLIKNEQNWGKAGAIKNGIKQSKGQIIAMIDADLIGLTHNDMDRLIDPVEKNKYSSTILDRAGDRAAIWGWTNCARFFGGERALWKEDFLKMEIPQKSGYLLETKMNFYYIENKKKIKTIYCPKLYTVHQYSKMPFFKGAYNYIKMSKQILNNATPLGFLVMFLKVEEERFSFLYDLHNYQIIFSPLTLAATLLHSTTIFFTLNIARMLKLPESWAKLYKQTQENINRMIKF
jgi:polyisoprenyl-phosphate glycosyltransferase